MYLHIANQSIIEVGKRLIQAKELVPHGEWYNWLKQNFNLTAKMANNFMRIVERWGANRKSTSDFDISTFNQTQLMELLALPEGDEQKFIAEKAAEGNPADQMTIKQLRAEIGGLMEPLLEIAAEEATEKATAETKKATLLENIRNLMDSTKWTAKQAMDALKIPSEEQKEYLSLLA